MKKTTLALLSLSLLTAVAQARDGGDNNYLAQRQAQAAQPQAVAQNAQQNIKVELPNAQERAEFRREKH